MDLELTRKILAVTEAQPYGFIKLRGRRIAEAAQEMQSMGLVELSAVNIPDPDIVVIKSVTEAGRRFLRVVGDRAFAPRLQATAGSSTSPANQELEVTLL